MPLPATDPIRRPLSQADRVLVYAARFARGEAVFHPDDARGGGDYGRTTGWAAMLPGDEE